jgi:dGTPase
MGKASSKTNSLNLYTPDSMPWSTRKYPETGNDHRTSYHRDRDRILHCESFRKLQHKTQVFVVQEGDFFRTRLTHSIEVAQIGRSLARMLELTEPLVEAICFAHDLGHAPFGHSGEHILNNLLKAKGGWNSNAYSLTIVDDLEIQYCEHRGLNLTWATREGLARHKTNFDKPSGEVNEYARYNQPSLEVQVANIADIIAYSTHDVEDALAAGIISVNDLRELQNQFWDTAWRKANKELRKAHSESIWPGVDINLLLNKRTHRHLIDYLIRDVATEFGKRIKHPKITTLEEARGLDQPLVSFSPDVQSQVNRLLDFMTEIVYQGPIVARQNYRAGHILRSLFEALSHKDSLNILPLDVQEQINKGSNKSLEIARFLASLTDRGATDLYAELFEPSERAMGHHIPL